MLGKVRKHGMFIIIFYDIMFILLLTTLYNACYYRSNVGTHPTTATQTRSTSRPHVFHQQTHPSGVGMSIGQAFDFDPFLSCNSHHIRRTSTTTSSTVTSRSQGTRTNQTTTESQSQTQTGI